MKTELTLTDIQPGQKQRLSQMKRLYRQAFPRAERKPFGLMLKKQKEGIMEILSIEDESGEFAGLAIIVLHHDLALLDYFAIAPKKREKGTGSAAFSLLKERYANRRFFLEIESPKVKSRNPEQRKRRKAFYLRNGMTVLPFMVSLFGTEMELLANNCTLEFEEYREIYHDIFGAMTDRKIQLYFCQQRTR